jgi:hypothetical protein
LEDTVKLRLATLNAPLFTSGGLNLNERWSEVETNDLTAEQRDTIEKFTGRVVQIHPDDIEKFTAETGLEFEDGSFRYPGGEDGAKDKPAIGDRHQSRERTTAEEKAADADVTASGKRKAGAPGPAVTASETRNMGNAVEVSKTGDVSTPKLSETSQADTTKKGR